MFLEKTHFECYPVNILLVKIKLKNEMKTSDFSLFTMHTQSK